MQDRGEKGMQIFHNPGAKSGRIPAPTQFLCRYWHKDTINPTRKRGQISIRADFRHDKKDRHGFRSQSLIQSHNSDSSFWMK
jgi:hypothetical protein